MTRARDILIEEITKAVAQAIGRVVDETTTDITTVFPDAINGNPYAIKVLLDTTKAQNSLDEMSKLLGRISAVLK